MTLTGTLEGLKVILLQCTLSLSMNAQYKCTFVLSSFRPYDLQVVHSSEAGSEHYIFSPNTVLHVTERGYGGLVSLARWYRESVLWTALQEITFFREFKMWKTFTW